MCQGSEVLSWLCGQGSSCKGHDAAIMAQAKTRPQDDRFLNFIPSQPWLALPARPSANAPIEQAALAWDNDT